MRLILLVMMALVAGAQDFSLYKYGPPPVAPGVGNSWVIVTELFESAFTGDIYIEPITLPEGITVRPWCASGNGGQYNLGWLDCAREEGGLLRYYQPQGGVGVVCYHLVLAFSAGAAVEAGTYEISVGISTTEYSHSITIPVVVAVPTVPPAKQPTALLDIPRKSEFVDNVASFGGSMCTSLLTEEGTCPTDGGQFCYTSAWESLVGYKSLWYYDGASTFFGMADETGDAETWNPCAYAVVDDFVRKAEATTNPALDVVALANQVSMTHGLYEAWRRTADPTQKARYAAALQKLVNQVPYANAAAGSYQSCNGPGGILANPCALNGDTTGLVSRDLGTRETALLGSAYLYNVLVGNYQAGTEQYGRAQRNAEWLMLVLHETSVANNYIQYEQPFFAGVVLRFLADYYDWSGDTRVPEAVKAMLDWVWETSVDSSNYKLSYSSFPSQQSQTGQIPGFVENLCSVVDGGCGGTPYTATFNGTTVTGATAGASATVTLTGYTVTAADQWGTLIIRGGANFVLGHHQIVSVNVGNNTFTLAGNVSTGDGSGLLGYFARNATAIDGTNVAAAASGAGSTLTLTGRAPVSGDVGRWIYLFSGASTIAGRYNIISVDTENGVLTLDRACTTGETDDVTGLLVTPRYDLISAPGLLAPLYLWYWRIGGGEEYRERGFRIWNTTSLTSWNGKELNQQSLSAWKMYEWATPRSRSGSAEAVGRVGP